MDWTIYTPEEARNGLKRLTDKKGPRFDYMSTPTAKAPESTSRRQSSRPSYNATKPHEGGWVPPKRPASTHHCPNQTAECGDEEDME